MHAEKRVEYHSDDRDGYTPCRQMHTTVIIEMAILYVGTCTRSRVITYFLHGFIKLDPWSNACGKKGRVPQ